MVTKAANKLSARDKLFVSEYLIDMNAVRAAKRAGFADSTAEKKAPMWVTADRSKSTKPNVWDAVQAKLDERCEKVEIDAEYVLKRHTEIDQMDVLDIYSEDGRLKPIQEWPKIWRQYISGIDIAELFEGQGDDRKVAGILKKIKWPDKVKNLELLGKHVNVQAYKEQANVGFDIPGEVSVTIVGKESAAAKD